MSDAPLLQVIIAGTSRKTGAEIKKLSDLPASIFQISRSDAWNLT
ncbi:TPA: resolvase, partial [Escherichia coli]